ncbi:glycosyltransferase [Vibrio ordalii]|uniref:glycosyltransferase n=1 Tax=Vibrio ordalii TaxID=28174 RepID=UPI002577065B|nr:glycosyltransferase [Vibrio ordalii]MCS0350762.1 glycosyltransferase [Vibrio ordalii]
MFSIVLCVNKDNYYLDQAIESVLFQSFEKFELIIVANNCTDELYIKLKKISETDMRIKLFRTFIGQLCFNLNYAINEAQYEHIVRMDADDVCYPNRLDIINTIIKRHDADIYCFSYEIINEDGFTIDKVFFPDGAINSKKLFFKNTICHPTVVFKRSSILKLRGYSGGFQSEDLDLWFRAIRDGMTIFSSSKITLKYRIHTQQSRGNVLPYCEVSGYILRELLLNFSFIKFFALFFSLFKRYLRPYK